MREEKSAVSRSLATTIVILIVIAAGAAIYIYTPQTSAPPTSSSTSSSTTSSTTSTTSSSSVQAPSFVQQNTFVAEGPANFQWLDPQVSYYSYDYGIIQNVYETLLWWNGTNGLNPIPWLASNFTVVTPSKVVIGLRQGIKFQDGTPFNATAVAFTFNRLLVMDGTSATGVHGSQAAWIIQQLLNHDLSTYFSGTGSKFYTQAWVKQVLAQNFVQILGPYKIQLNIQNPTAALPFLLAGEWAAIVSPSWVIRHDYPRAHENLTAYYVHQAGNGSTSLNLPTNGAQAGTGPYVISSVNPTTYEVVLTANPNYWGGPPGYMFGRIKPTIQKIDLLVVNDQTTRLLDLKAGKATTVIVTPDSIFSVIDRNTYLSSGKYVSALPGVVFNGPYTYYNTGWLDFDTNVTSSVGGPLLSFQPFADLRFRLAVSDSVNVTDVLRTVANGLDLPANWIYPPGTAPSGSYQPNAKPAWGYNLTKAEQLLKDFCANPLTKFTYFNGTKIPSGVVNNSCTTPHTVPLTYQSGDTVTEKILTQAAENLNAISYQDKLGLSFSVVPVPAGTLYTEASEHLVYTYWGGWIDDYNWVIDWLGPMFLPTGTYFSWNLWNDTKLTKLVNAATIADQKGDIRSLLGNATAIAQIENKNVYYWLHEYVLYYWVGSTWVHNWFYNSEFSPNADYFAAMSFAPPGSS